jgi:hypothetical protein
MSWPKPHLEVAIPRDIVPESEVERAKALQEGAMFHGTGRYAIGYEGRDKRKPTGRTVDVLKEVLSKGIQPQKDIISRIFLPVEETISLTRQRMYARCYAELFGQDEEKRTNLEYTFGEMKDWWPYFVHETSDNILSPRSALLMPAVIKNLMRRFSKEEILHIFDKYDLLKRWNVNRARIRGNYPMIFGIQAAAIEPIPIPHGLDYFEIRCDRPVSPEALKFVEVPKRFIDETRNAVEEVGAVHLDVLPFEAGEAACASRGVTNCIVPNPEIEAEARTR